MLNYESLPTWGQHIYTTLANNWRYYQKFKAIPYLRPLGHALNVAPRSTKCDLLDQINELLTYATTNVPYYRQHRDKYRTISCIEEFNRVPVLSKSTLQTHNNLFISRLARKWNSYPFKTSGSSGTPIYGLTSLHDLRRRFRALAESMREFGIDYSRPVGRFLSTPLHTKGPVYRHDYINGHLLLSILYLGPRRIDEYYDILKRSRIEILEGYPSTIATLARLFLLNGYSLPDVRFVITTAETLTADDRDSIMACFRAPIFNYYGSNEGSALLTTSRHGGFSNSPEVAHIEVVDDSLRPLLMGQTGRILVTSFTSHFTPIIRYDIGDIVTLASSDNGDMIESIEGRVDDYYTNPDGRVFSRFSLGLKYLPSKVIESQLLLVNNTWQGKLLYRTIDATALMQCDIEKFESKVQDLAGGPMRIEYACVSEIPKPSRGKRKAVRVVDNFDYN